MCCSTLPTVKGWRRSGTDFFCPMPDFAEIGVCSIGTLFGQNSGRDRYDLKGYVPVRTSGRCFLEDCQQFFASWLPLQTGEIQLRKFQPGNSKVTQFNFTDSGWFRVPVCARPTYRRPYPCRRQAQLQPALATHCPPCLKQAIRARTLLQESTVSQNEDKYTNKT